MLTDDEILDVLDDLGIDAGSYRLVALMPLVEVAWADGEVQPSERQLILAAAERHGLTSEPGRKLLEQWLTSPPSKYQMSQARKLLSGLVNRSRGLGEDVTLDTLDEVLAFCEGVADAAGGLFGFGRVAKSEREAMRFIADTLGVQGGKSWAELKDELS